MALTGSARAGAEIGSLAVVTVPGVTLPLTTSTVTLPVTTSTAVVLPTTTTLQLPLTTTTVTLPPLPTSTTLARVSTTSLTLPLTTSTLVVLPTTTTLQLPLTTTTVTLPPLPTSTTLARVSTTSLTLPLTTSTLVVLPTTTTLQLPLTTTTVTLPPLPTSTTTPAPATTTTITVSLPATGSSTTTTLPAALCRGDACDDGFSCTDDVCTAEGCLHVPIDSRCVPPDACSGAVCAPALPGHDAAGCIAGAPRAEGEGCAEDGDACTTDVCRGGTCAHEPAVDTTGCAPVQDPFRKTLALGELTQGLETEVAARGDERLAPLVARLLGIESDLAAAARALAGEPVARGAATRALAAGFEPAAAIGISAEQRARIAFTQILRTPRQVAAFLNDLAAARERAGLPPAIARDFHRRGRMLLRGTKALKAELRRLQREPGRRHARKAPPHR